MSEINKTKYAVLAVGAIALAGVNYISGISDEGVKYTASKEGYVAAPYRDSVGVPTIGIGTTVYPDGKRVTMRDKPIDRKVAESYLKAHMNKDAIRFNKSLSNVKGTQGVLLSQTEYDVYMDFSYQFGVGNWQKSSMLVNLKQGKYAQACNSLLKWYKAGGRDCRVRSNNCYGVWTRQLERHKQCTAVNK